MRNGMLWVVACFCLVGCQRVFTITNDQVYVGEQGTTHVPGFGDAGVEVMTEQNGVFTTWPSVRRGDAYEVTGLPAGDVLVHVGTDWFVSGGDSLDLGHANLGRADAQQVVTNDTDLDVTPSGVPAGFDVTGYGVEFFSPGAGLYGFAASAGPFTGQFTVPYRNEIGPSAYVLAPAVDAAKGDTLWALWFDTVNLGVMQATPSLELLPFSCGVLTAAAHATGVTVAGPSTSVALSVAGTPTSMAFDMPRSQWAALTGGKLPLREDFAIGPMPSGSLTVPVTWPDLMTCSLFTGGLRFVAREMNDLSGTVAAFNPFPSSWPLVTTYVLRAAAPGTGPTTEVEYGGIFPANQPVVPGVHAPENVTVQGLTAQGLPVGATLSVSWQAPSAGPTPSGYVVVLQRRIRGVDTTHFEAAPFAARTTHTSLLLPAPALTVGQKYSVVVRALGDASWSPSKPNQGGIPATWADGASAEFTVQ
jgi:hypothetical protein